MPTDNPEYADLYRQAEDIAHDYADAACQGACAEEIADLHLRLMRPVKARLEALEAVAGAMQDIRHLSLNYQKGLGIRMQEIGKIAHQTLSTLDDVPKAGA